MATRDKILTLLRREVLTIAELAARLGKARNAIVLPVQQLEAAGLIEASPREEKRAGKPSLEYTAVAGREDAASLAYPAFTELVVQALPSFLSAEDISDLMRQVGKKMATDLIVDERADFTKRLKAATDFADALGAETTVEVGAKGAVIRSYSCPLGRAVRQQPCVCSAMATFFADVIGVPVEEQCQRGDRLYCKFAVGEG